MNGPIIILGAARSGTKMLRGIFSSHPDVAVFPSEIDYIWRYGNENHPNDELTFEHARPEVVEHVREKFTKLSTRHNGARVVEKTCSNSLRVDFVHSIFPDAYFVHILRDGRANVESVRRSWESGVSVNYYRQKFHGINFRDSLYFAPDYLKYHIRRRGLFGGTNTVKGPHFEGIERLLQEKSFLEVCGIQWKTCVQKAITGLGAVPPKQVVEIRYENLVENPIEQTELAFNQVGLEFLPSCRAYIKRNIHDNNLEKWKRNLSSQELQILLPHINTKLTDLGYIV